jgi:hypothetical protein
MGAFSFGRDSEQYHVLEQIKMMANYWQFHVQSLHNANGPDQRFERL